MTYGASRDGVSPSSLHIPHISDTAECQEEEGAAECINYPTLGGSHCQAQIDTGIISSSGKTEMSPGDLEHCWEI